MDRILGLGRESFSALKALLRREEAAVTGAVDALAAHAELPALLGLESEEVARLSDADVLGLLLATPALRAELKLVRRVESEPDTTDDENGGGGEATDMDDLD